MDETHTDRPANGRPTLDEIVALDQSIKRNEKWHITLAALSLLAIPGSLIWMGLTPSTSPSIWPLVVTAIAGVLVAYGVCPPAQHQLLRMKRQYNASFSDEERGMEFGRLLWRLFDFVYAHEDELKPPHNPHGGFGPTSTLLYVGTTRWVLLPYTLHTDQKWATLLCYYGDIRRHYVHTSCDASDSWSVECKGFDLGMADMQMATTEVIAETVTRKIPTEPFYIVIG